MITSNAIKLYVDGFYTSRAFQWYQECQIWSLNENVMALRSVVATTTFHGHGLSLFLAATVFYTCNVVMTVKTISLKTKSLTMQPKTYSIHGNGAKNLLDHFFEEQIIDTATKDLFSPRQQHQNLLRPKLNKIFYVFL